ncbi:hypothetical protein CL657_03945 [bacterium]|nr:hypothetical protein [bacterium]
MISYKSEKKMKVNIMIIASIIMISLYINVTEANINTLRTNELLFYTGHSIKDGVNEERGMASPIPPQVCYRETNKTGGPLNDYCSITYSSYYLQYEFPGTMNITLNTSPNEPDRVLKVIAKSVYINDSSGQPIKKTASGGGIDGFAQFQPPTTNIGSGNCAAAQNCYNQQLKLRSSIDGDSMAQEAKANTTNDYFINRAYTTLQLGQTRYGESLWVHQDEDNEVMTISSYKAVDWSLKPVVPMGFSINAIGTDPMGNSDVYFGDRIKITTANDGKGSLCITSSNVGFASSWCKNDAGGLYIAGNANINRLYGEIGFVKTSYSSNNFVGKEIEHIVPSHNNNGLEHNLAIIGFVVSGHPSDPNTYNYWMAVATGNSTSPSCSGGTGTKLSHYGKFDFQSGWNENASYMFVVMDTDQGSTSDQQRRVKFCTTADTDTGLDQKSGVALYGLPKTE